MINATRSNWLLHLETIKNDPNSQECISIYPLDGLTQEMVIAAMSVQGMDANYYRLHPATLQRSTASWIAHQHGNVIYIRRLNW